ncbi:MAG: SPOR domain-containing protein [Candidatus Omnitrophica bacterium]|nr:SPOR domain-containing protein [Candidatus Omnitrophota bacterium]
MRYVIVFLIGFFVGGFFGGDLGLFFKKTKNIVLQKTQDEEKSIEVTDDSESQPIIIEVEQPKPKPIEKKVVLPPKETHSGQEKLYTVQVASFKTREQADKYVKDLVNQEFDAYVSPSRPSEPGNFYRVCIGETISLDQAKALNSKLKSKFKDSFVYQF